MTSVRPSAAFAFTSLLLIHDPLIELTSSALVSLALLAIGLSWFCLALLRRTLTGSPSWTGGLTTFGVICALAVLGKIYSLMDGENLNVRVQFLSIFMLMPLIWVAFSEQAT